MLVEPASLTSVGMLTVLWARHLAGVFGSGRSGLASVCRSLRGGSRYEEHCLLLSNRTGAFTH